MNEEQIIDLIKNGKIEKAFVKLYKIFPRVRGILKKYGATKTESHDIFQDALVVLYQKLQQSGFHVETSVEAYLTNTCRYMYLKTRKGEMVTMEPKEVIQEEMDIENILLEDKKIRQAELALQQIGEKCRDLLISFYIGKRSMLEIAKQFSFSSENVAKTQKYKCLESARKNYQELMHQQNTL